MKFQTSSTRRGNSLRCSGLFIFISLILLHGFIPNSSLSAEKITSQKQELIVGQVSSNAGSLDPYFMSQMQDFPVAEMVFGALVKYAYDSPTLKFEPDLAKSWEVSRDGLRWKFHLRKGVKWHKGYGEVTSDDVVFSLRKAMNHSMVSPQYKKAIKNVSAQGKYIVNIDLNEPDPYFLRLVMNWGGGYVFCKRAIRDVLGEKAISSLKFRLAIDPKQIVGFGPFIYQELIPGQASILVANPEYFKGEPILKKVTIRYIPSFKTRDFAFRSGDVDMMPGARVLDWAKEILDLGFKINFNKPPSFYLLWMNQNVKPLEDLRVRRAIAHAINKDDIIAIMGGKTLGIRAAKNPLTTVAEGYTTEGVRQYEFNPQKARELLAQAGYSKGLRFSMFVSEREVYRRPMEIIQANLRKIGVELELKIIAHGDYHAKNRKGLNPFTILGQTLATGQMRLDQVYHSDAIATKPTGSRNYSMYGNPQIDAKIDEARVTMDSKKRKALYADIQRRLMEDLIAIPLLEGPYPIAKAPYVDLGYNHAFTLTYFYHITEKARLLQRKP